MKSLSLKKKKKRIQFSIVKTRLQSLLKSEQMYHMSAFKPMLCAFVLVKCQIKYLVKEIKEKKKQKQKTHSIRKLKSHEVYTLTVCTDNAFWNAATSATKTTTAEIRQLFQLSSGDAREE